MLLLNLSKDLKLKLVICREQDRNSKIIMKNHNFHIFPIFLTSPPYQVSITDKDRTQTLEEMLLILKIH